MIRPCQASSWSITPMLYPCCNNILGSDPLRTYPRRPSLSARHVEKIRAHGESRVITRDETDRKENNFCEYRRGERPSLSMVRRPRGFTAHIGGKRMNAKISAILLAGGKGTRMQMPTPKQFLLLKEKPIALYSFQLLAAMPEIQEIVVVCEPEFRFIFQAEASKTITFAAPGERRQDSVYNGLKAIQQAADTVCVHDAARPFITAPLVQRVLLAAQEHGAAAAGMPIKFTLKEHDGNAFVKSTPDRSLYWEIQTPQAIRTPLLIEGFRKADAQRLTFTDDVSLVESLQLPVKLVRGCHSNIKITTPEDLDFAAHFLRFVKTWLKKIPIALIAG